MNVIQITSIFIILLVPALTVNSYGQISEKTAKPIYIFVQTEVRNSDGQLAAYLEASKIFITDLERLDRYLDSLPVNSTRKIGGQNYDVIEVHLQKNITETKNIAKTLLGVRSGGNLVYVAHSEHDGYPIASGDIVKSIWAILRPAR